MGTDREENPVVAESWEELRKRLETGLQQGTPAAEHARGLIEIKSSETLHRDAQALSEVLVQHRENQARLDRTIARLNCILVWLTAILVALGVTAIALQLWQLLR